MFWINIVLVSIFAIVTGEAATTSKKQTNVPARYKESVLLTCSSPDIHPNITSIDRFYWMKDDHLLMQQTADGHNEIMPNTHIHNSAVMMEHMELASSFRISNFIAEFTGWYHCIVFFKNGSHIQAFSANIVMIPDKVLYTGDRITTTFECSAKDGRKALVWYKNDDIITLEAAIFDKNFSVAANGSLVLQNVPSTVGDGLYTCVLGGHRIRQYRVSLNQTDSSTSKYQTAPSIISGTTGIIIVVVIGILVCSIAISKVWLKSSVRTQRRTSGRIRKLLRGE